MKRHKTEWSSPKASSTWVAVDLDAGAGASVAICGREASLRGRRVRVEVSIPQACKNGGRSLATASEKVIVRANEALSLLSPSSKYPAFHICPAQFRWLANYALPATALGRHMRTPETIHCRLTQSWREHVRSSWSVSHGIQAQ